MIEIKNTFKKGNKNKLCYINIYTFVSLYWACYIVCSKRGKCNIWILYKYTGYSRIFTRVYKFNTKDSTLQQLKKEKKRKFETIQWQFA